MGILDLFKPGKKAEEITRACIGAYKFSRMNDDQRQAVMVQVYLMLRESAPFPLTFDEAEHKFNTSPAMVQAGFMVNAMIYLKIHHDVLGFEWDYIPNPFALSVCSDKILGIACSKLRSYGINPGDCFEGKKEIA